MSTRTTRSASAFRMGASLDHPEPRRERRGGAVALVLAAAALLPGCSSIMPSFVRGPSVPMGTPGFVSGFFGGVATEEPRAAIVSRDILSAGGSAVDAAVAGAFALSVTLPSRAGLGGGGACIVYNNRRREVEAVAFPAGARSVPPQGADRPAAVPMMARGLYLLHTRGGRLRFEQLVRPAEDLARFGTEVSRALTDDLAAVAAPLLNDPNARAVFGAPGGGPLRPGDRITQLDLGATLAQMRTGGVGELYQGGLSDRFADGSVIAGGGVTQDELRAARAQVVATERVDVSIDSVFFLPGAVDGGAGTAQAFQAVMAGQPALPPVGAPVGASTTLITMDQEGNAVTCAFSMNNLFGTGRVVPGTGILLAAAPGIGNVPPAPLAVALATNRDRRSFRAAAAGSGQYAAGAAAGATMAAALRRVAPGDMFTAVPDPGRGMVIACPSYAPGSNASCIGTADPRGTGVSIGTFGR
ncbi:gamma-glutamyltranspeptidase [Roseomonas sp. JC162]|uniref:Gamma-glutamyltranspeptidase n=1 Tax=Neoroseomonas marina TaxID=1232220 RepID=A0A848EGC4_9PROT|nr:gamma-glutamyltransferase [Neoroseomonas marina]NMJ42639.1 gamma-glutamyltranspeptidase [Neoroseomonas marina]